MLPIPMDIIIEEELHDWAMKKDTHKSAIDDR